jgi:hypothetical protein
MACICVPQGPLTITRAGQVRQRVPAVLRSRDWLSDTVVRLRFEPEGEFTCRPGQFLSLVDPASQVARSYSIAGCADGLIELHVRIVPGGRMSSALSSVIAPGYRVIISGPSGACFYDDIDPDRQIVLRGREPASRRCGRSSTMHWRGDTEGRSTSTTGHSIGRVSTSLKPWRRCMGSGPASATSPPFATQPILPARTSSASSPERKPTWRTRTFSYVATNRW